MRSVCGYMRSVCGYMRSIGLRKDGRVVCSSDDRNICDFALSLKDIVMISGSVKHNSPFAALRKDGTVAVYDPGNNNAYNQWRNIVSIACTRSSVIGVTSGGAVLCEDREYGMDFSDWKDIIAVASDTVHTKNNNFYICVAGLTRKGEVLIKHYKYHVKMFGGVRSCVLDKSEKLEYGIFDHMTSKEIEDRSESIIEWTI